MATTSDKQFDTVPGGVARFAPPSNESEQAAGPRWLWFYLAVLFAASGCAALIYEIVWFQMLQLVIGSTAISLGLLLASFMGGMCLGSVFLPSYLGANRPPLRIWALLELGIGALGIAVLFVVPWLTKLYAAFVPGGLVGILFRGILSAVCLFPPTVLMGATLPVVSRLAPNSARGMSRMGLIYAANTVGAVCGALLAGFVLLKNGDLSMATWAAACLNGIIALAGISLRPGTMKLTPVDPMERDGSSSANQWRVYLTIALSGLCALGAEVVWTRLLSLMLGATTYTFSIILAVFLLGLGIGSAAGALLARQNLSVSRVLGICQLLLAAAIAWTAFMLARSLPFWPINPSLSNNVWFNFQLDFVRCLWAIFPATFLWGASFPLALGAAAHAGRDTAQTIGRLYAANTAGAIVGALFTSVILVAWFGTQQTQRLLVGVSLIAGAIVLVRPQADQGTTGLKSLLPELRRWLPLFALLAVLVWSVPSLPWTLVAYGRYLPSKTELGKILYLGEGMNASVAVTESSTGVRNFHVSGKVEASSDQQDMRLQRMLGHIPALFHPEPQTVLVVGCGAGVTAGSFLVHPSIQKVSLCEIEPLIPKLAARYFAQENYDVIQDPRVRLIYDDARHYILTTKESFDIITSDPIHPWVKGAASLYTKEYFELCKRHLKPGGMITQWVPLYESDFATVRSEIATFFEVFPHGTIWSNDDLGAGYDLVLLGQVEPLEVDVETLQRRLNREDHTMVAQSLRDVGIRSGFGLVATYAGQARDLEPWLRHAQINRDQNLKLQYLAGLGLNVNASDLIYEDLSSYRRFPEEIFTGSNQWNEALRRALQLPKPKGSTQAKATTR